MIRFWVSERIRNFFHSLMLNALERDAYDVKRSLHRMAREESAEFLKENVSLELYQPSRKNLISHCLNQVSEEGLLLEFGVFEGKSINYSAQQLPSRHFYGFDSFEGLQESWIFSRPGAFQMEALPKVRDNVTLVKGFFDTSLPPFLDEHDGPCAFIHVDSDLYSSCVTIFELLKQRIVPGTIILFDEFYNYPGWKEGEYKAFNEFVTASGVEYEYLGFTADKRIEWDAGHQVAVRVK